MGVVDDLRQYGPDSSATVDLPTAQAYCARLTAEHYENFSVVTWLTPRHLRPALEAVYAFCRWSDDLGDEVGDQFLATELLRWWRGELERLFLEGEARHPVFVALQPIVHEYALPIDPFAALITAFEQDQIVLEYDTYDQLLDYCTRSANPVGRLVLHLARAHTAENAALSDATCTALQLANFWQDVARDFEIGRIYLPREDRQRFGVSPRDLADRRCTPEFRKLLEFEVTRARELFERGRPLVMLVPAEIALDIDLFTRGGLAILNRIVQQNYDVLSQRPALTRTDKLRLLGRALVGRLKVRAAAGRVHS